MKSLHKMITIFLVLMMVFPLSSPLNDGFAADVDFDYGEEQPQLTQTESQGRDTGSSGSFPGGGDIPGGGSDGDSPGFWESLWNWGKEVVQEAGHTVAEFIGDAGESLGDAIAEFAPNLGEKIKEYSNHAENVIKGLTNPESLGDFLKTLAAGIFVMTPVGWGAILGDLLASGLTDAWNAMPDWAQGLLKGLAVGLAVAAAIIAGAYLLAALGVIAIGTLLTATVLAGLGALGAAIYGAIAGGENFNPFVAGGIVLGTVFIPLSGKIAGFLLSTRTGLMLGAKGYIAFGRFSSWLIPKLSAGWASVSGFMAANKMGFLIGGTPAFLQHWFTLMENPSAFDLRTALVDIATGALAGGLLAPFGSGFAALSSADKWKRVLSASGIGGGIFALGDWASGNGFSMSSFFTGALITSVFFPLGAQMISFANHTIGRTLNTNQRTAMNHFLDFINGVRQTAFTHFTKGTFIQGFNKLGELISNSWSRLFDGNLSNVDHLDTDQLQNNIDQNTSDRSS
ncbi:hypothetical protein [Alteribacillus iranensis]|uniref:Integral membrane protein n=1 Tax=Alteribacillus iranensis TaxID=930128 RepID=A0A1I2D2V1_9BACI|nr:hypothetical protein [Alteribacillus iranensis]SFE74300.1 hypothetical protein SAMN05192532_103335 [Alteribacillus iranensis]